MAKGKKAVVVSSVQQRLIDVCQHYGISLREMSRTIGRSDNYVNTLRNDVTSGVLCKVLEVYPEVSPVWLLTGKGTMLDSVLLVHPGGEGEEQFSVEGSQEAYKLWLKTVLRGENVEFNQTAGNCSAELASILRELPETHLYNERAKAMYNQLKMANSILKKMVESLEPSAQDEARQLRGRTV